MVGTTDGHIYQFLGGTLKTAIKAHTGPVHALYVCKEGLVSGGKDGLVKVWTPSMDIVGEFDLKKLGSVEPGLRSVCWDVPRKRLLVGTVGAEIYEVRAWKWMLLQGARALSCFIRARNQRLYLEAGFLWMLGPCFFCEGLLSLS